MRLGNGAAPVVVDDRKGAKLCDETSSWYKVSTSRVHCRNEQAAYCNCKWGGGGTCAKHCELIIMWNGGFTQSLTVYNYVALSLNIV